MIYYFKSLYIYNTTCTNTFSKRKFAKTKSGMERFAISFPKYNKGGYVIKEIIEPPIFSEFICIM